MEQLILTCLEAQLLMGKVLKGNNPNAVKIEVIEEIVKVTPESLPHRRKSRLKERSLT
jgi:hypothetical protein